MELEKLDIDALEAVFEKIKPGDKILVKFVLKLEIPQGKGSSAQTQGRIPMQYPVADRIVVAKKLL